MKVLVFAAFAFGCCTMNLVNSWENRHKQRRYEKLEQQSALAIQAVDDAREILDKCRARE